MYQIYLPSKFASLQSMSHIGLKWYFGGACEMQGIITKALIFNLIKTCSKFNQGKFDAMSLQWASLLQVESHSDICTLFWNYNQNEWYKDVTHYWNVSLLNDCNSYW